MKWIINLIFKRNLDNELITLSEILGYKDNSFMKDKLWKWSE